jgi:hypothetical protein
MGELKKYKVILTKGKEEIIYSTNWYEAKKQAWQKHGIRNILSVKLVKEWNSSGK